MSLPIRRPTLSRAADDLCRHIRKFNKTEPRDAEGQWSLVGAAKKLLTGTPEKLHDDEATTRAAFEFHDAPTGLTAKVEGIRSSGPLQSTYVDVSITGRDGQPVGGAVRTIRPADQKTVHFDGMALEPGAQGHGFATRYNAATDEALRANGIERATTFASMNVGGYSNARMGYDFDGGRGDVATRALAAAPKYSAEVQAEIHRVANDPKATPLEFAMIGHAPGAKTWPGKEIMLGSMWGGVRPLS